MNENRPDRMPARVSDPLLVQDVFATGVLPPEFDGSHVRICCYAERREPHAERVVVLRVVFTRENFDAALRTVVEAAASLKVH